MKVSLNTIKQYIDFELPPVDELVAQINSQLGGVEEVIDFGAKYKDAKIVKVVECEKHPNADKLSVCKIDAGTGELITVVCGAPNVHTDMWAVWLPPESVVPSTYDDNEPFRLTARELRGVTSNGMLAAGDELDINNDHNGIIELDVDEWRPYAIEIKSGTSFAAAYGLDDIIIDIENKMFTHRPDCFGQLGVAREVAGITGRQFTSPSWYKVLPEFNRGDVQELRVENNASAVVPRFMAVLVKDVVVKASPLWLQCELVRLGSKPINNIVDVTNYIMLLTGQPTHAYDYDKLRGQALIARMANEGETITLLNNKTYELTPDDIVIADAEGPVGLAGIMGGRDSEVSDTTTNVVLECATFDMYAVRRSSMRHGVFTDALTRFNKGQSPLQNPYILSLLLSSLYDVAGGRQASDIYDVGTTSQALPAVKASVEFINSRLGLQLSTDEVMKLLQCVEIDVSRASDQSTELSIVPPFWRTDIEQPEDVVEEVGRLHGFDKLPRELPRRLASPAAKNTRRVLKQRVRDSLTRAGANEVLSYSFVHENVMKRAGQNTDYAFRLSNALSPDLQFYRLSVLPSLLDKVHMNTKLGYDEFVLFEIGKGHNKHAHAADDGGLPKEPEYIDMVYACKTEKQGAAYFVMRQFAERLMRDLKLAAEFRPSIDAIDGVVSAPFEPSRSATIALADGNILGIVGELKQTVKKAFKLPAATAAASFDLAALQAAVDQKTNGYVPLSKYPTITQDISLKVGCEVSYSTIEAIVREALAAQLIGVLMRVEPVSIYQSPDDMENKTITLHIECTSYEKTLTDDTINAAMEHVAKQAASRSGAIRI